MGFIREYMDVGDAGRMRDLMDDVGDPRRKRGFFRRLKKFKFGRALGGIARAGVGFVPGVGPIASRVLEMVGDPGDDEDDYDFIGDPGRKAKRRKMAGAGTKAKAAKKRKGRRQKGKRRPSGTPIDFGKLAEAAIGSIPVAGGIAQELISQVRGGGAAGEAAAAELLPQLGAMPGKRGRGLRMPGMFGKRRGMNPANVKALRRGLRRVEGFEKLVKRVQKAYPRLRAMSSGGGGGARARGHRAACRCVACKARAA